MSFSMYMYFYHQTDIKWWFEILEQVQSLKKDS